MSTFRAGDRVRRTGGVLEFEVTMVQETFAPYSVVYTLKRADAQDGERYRVTGPRAMLELVERAADGAICNACGDHGPLTDLMICEKCEAELMRDEDDYNPVPHEGTYRTPNFPRRQS